MLRIDSDLPAPQRMRAGDAAADLPSAADIELAPGARALVPTGFSVAVPEGHCGLILPRSGLALTHGITVMNAPGLIDSGYRGELKVILVNLGSESVKIERGQRIAQFLVLDVPSFSLADVAQLPDAPDQRGADGFGSSG